MSSAALRSKQGVALCVGLQTDAEASAAVGLHKWWSEWHRIQEVSAAQWDCRYANCAEIRHYHACTVFVLCDLARQQNLRPAYGVAL
jgi:hypothetical protein